MNSPSAGTPRPFLDAGAREHFRDFNGALQVAYFILGVRAAGLAAGPMTGYDASALEAELFPQGDRPLALSESGHVISAQRHFAVAGSHDLTVRSPYTGKEVVRSWIFIGRVRWLSASRCPTGRAAPIL